MTLSDDALRELQGQALSRQNQAFALSVRIAAAIEANKTCCPGRHKCDDCQHLPSGESALEPCACRMCKAVRY